MRINYFLNIIDKKHGYGSLKYNKDQLVAKGNWINGNILLSLFKTSLV